MVHEAFEGFDIHHYMEVSSTNEEALDLLEKGISSETVIVANKQTEGRGRTGKSWISPEGNLYTSLIIDQAKDINRLTELTFVTAIAVGNAIQSSINSCNIQYKWPNDVLVDGKKISGILLEKKSNTNWLVIGIGININHAPLSTATCMGDYGVSVSNIDLLKELIINFNKVRKQWLSSGFYAIREMWLKRAFKLNEQISIKLADKLYEGIFANINENGRLVLQQKNGSLIYFDTGIL
ncbi:biotin--[acetyl-CoA-carboxylase] ligase [Wolbachia endosymbiont of Ctenocephalides felis wCfeT]|uniref:biotin--[acetyl-CoA-carboxylase] ligase n=1 Tax=Wolbachia endosymbiont of Ctenocephalides felis wCfeT TaxID=2732593 RepID=UPI0014464E67|nr:biotin--[acetyl-CoA-carboxylase] ligase [Wolbachia endosymbiont of Ctenocephalides felis wCfeT]